jgi:hypothetical protein
MASFKVGITTLTDGAADEPVDTRLEIDMFLTSG